MPWTYFGFIYCVKNEVEHNEVEINYLMNFINEELKTTNKERTIYKHIENIFNTYYGKHYEYNIPLLYQIQLILNMYSKKSSLNKKLTKKINNIYIHSKDNSKDWIDLYKDIQQKQNKAIPESIKTGNGYMVY